MDFRIIICDPQLQQGVTEYSELPTHTVDRRMPFSELTRSAEHLLRELPPRAYPWTVVPCLAPSTRTSLVCTLPQGPLDPYVLETTPPGAPIPALLGSGLDGRVVLGHELSTFGRLTFDLAARAASQGLLPADPGRGLIGLVPRGGFGNGIASTILEFCRDEGLSLLAGALAARGVQKANSAFQSIRYKMPRTLAQAWFESQGITSPNDLRIFIDVRESWSLTHLMVCLGLPEGAAAELLMSLGYEFDPFQDLWIQSTSAEALHRRSQWLRQPSSE